MAKESIGVRISEVANLLIQGLKRKEIVEICKKNYKVKERVIDGYIKEAKPLIEGGKLAAKIEAKQNAIIAEAETGKVMSYIRKREILAEIMETKQATTQLLIVQTVIEEGTGKEVKKFIPVKAFTRDLTQERIKAIEADNRMTGDNAPDKHIHADIPLFPDIHYNEGGLPI